MAHDMLDEGLIDEGEALLRVDANRLEELFKRRVDATGGRRPIATGLNASPGAATGTVVFTADEAAGARTRGRAGHPGAARDDARRLPRHDRRPGHPDERRRHELPRRRRRPRRGHPGGVRRRRDQAARRRRPLRRQRHDRARGRHRSRSTASRGNVYVGELPLEESVLEKARQGDAAARQEKIWQAFERLMAVADERRRLRVRANADTPDQSTNARERGAEGIGLCRTEHMFLGEERVLAVRQMIFAETAEEEQAAYDALLPLQRERLRRHLHRDERAAGHGAPARPAAARVPARPGRARGRGRARRSERRRRHRAGDRAAEGERAARGEPDARPARGAAGHREAGALRDAGARDRRGGGRGEEGRRRPEGRDHDPARRDRARARPDARRARARGRPRSSSARASRSTTWSGAR